MGSVRVPGVQPAPTERARRRLWLRIVDAVVFGTASALTIVLIDGAIRNALSSGRALAYIVLAPMAAISVHRGFAFLQRRWLTGSPQRTRAVRASAALLKWVGSPLAAILLCVAVESAALARGLQMVREDLDPVVRTIEAKVNANGKPPDDVLEALGQARQVRSVNYYVNARGFVIATHGGSIDIDGETIYWDSTERRWRRFHNDLAETDDPDATHFRAATRDAHAARYRRSQAGWIFERRQ